MIEIFKTNVEKENDAAKLLQTLNEAFPAAIINFDLNDHDRVLRIEGSTINNNEVILIINSHGFTCKVIPDEICK